LDWFESTPGDQMFLSVMMLGEVRRGIERLLNRDPEQAAVLETWLHGLYDGFASRIISIDAEIAEEWGRISAPVPVPREDGLMAATARVRGMVLVTRNVAHVVHTGVRVLNPWEPLRP
jgi:predicted nucleic acid-binding protein